MITDPPYGVNYDPAWRKRAFTSRPVKITILTPVNHCGKLRDEFRTAGQVAPAGVCRPSGVKRKGGSGAVTSAFDPYTTYAPRPVLVERGLKNGSLDKPAQSELGSA